MQLSDRMAWFDSSGIRKVFDLAANLTNPINLSIGQPDFDVPAEIRQAAVDAVQSRKNGYSVTQGVAVLREKLQAQIDAEYGHPIAACSSPAAPAAAWCWPCWRWSTRVTK